MSTISRFSTFQLSPGYIQCVHVWETVKILMSDKMSTVLVKTLDIGCKCKIKAGMSSGLHYNCGGAFSMIIR